MKIGSLGLAGAAAASLVLAAATTADAQPADPAYHATLTGGAVVLTVDRATIAAGPDRTLQISDLSGARLAALPLGFLLDDQRGDLGYSLSDDARTVTLTPDLTSLRPATATEIASPLEEQRALDDLASGLTRNTLAGLVIGTVAGALVGGAVGLASCLVVGPGCLATVPAAVAAFASGGGITGTIAGGGTGAVGGLWKYLTIRNVDPGRSPDTGGDLNDPDGTGIPDAHLRLPSGSAAGLKSGSSAGSAHH
ncbi:hypothetical protein [Nocardia stercoris]|uniref:DUF8020 domain-containing protein n=1 Tax=Nocardia stercoris TaxID=2483361 RepID=A0A3M2KU64_9NOCA|nr:hypothetical protein [Nocardia stercoris]RMI28176.1 hypothetical protein EBN03_31245 [Nocardia stercoris]